MTAPEIVWKTPWRAIQFDAEIPGVQRQLEREISIKHPLFGKGATAIGRRIDNDDILVVLDDGSYANVHLVWGTNGSFNGPFPEKYPSWFAYGTLQDFLNAMEQDAQDYGDA